MTKLEAVIEKLKALPADEQDARAAEIEWMLDSSTWPLTDEQWAELDRRLADDGEETVPHEAVMAAMRAKYG